MIAWKVTLGDIMLRSGVSEIIGSDEKADWSASEFGFDGAVNYITDFTSFNTLIFHHIEFD